MSDFDNWYKSQTIDKPQQSVLDSEQKSDFEQWTENANAQQNTTLTSSLNIGQNTNPEIQARVLKQQMRTGLPTELITRNLDDIEKESKRADFDAGEFRKNSPIVANYLQNEDNAKLSHDDTESLTGIEWLFQAPAKAFNRGYDEVNLAQLRFHQITNQLNDDQLAMIEQIKSQRASNFGADSWLQESLVEASRQIPQLIETARTAGWTSLAGGASFGGGALAVGQMGPQVALPEEIVTVPAATVTGLGLGWKAGALEESFRLQTGFAYDEFLDFRDVNDQPLDDEVAKLAAITAGSINSGLELVSFDAITKSIPGADKILSKGGTALVKEALKNPTVLNAFKEFGKRYSTLVGTQVLTDVAQELVNMIAGEVAKSYQGDFQQADVGDYGERILQTADTSLKAAVLLAAPGPGANLAIDYTKAKKAENNRAMMENLGELATNSKTKQRVPEKFRELVKNIKEAGTVKNVMIPVTEWTTLFQNQNLNPEQVAAEVMGDNGQAYREAVATDTDFVIPLEAYADSLAASEYHQELLDNSRFHPEEMTPKEARQWQAENQQRLEETIQTVADTVNVQDESQFIMDDLVAQLKATGMSDTDSQTSAIQMQSVFNTLAQRTGVDVKQLWQRYGPAIKRQVPEELQQGMFDINLDTVINRIREDDIPKQQDAFGRSLLDVVRDIGVFDEGGELAARDIDVDLKPFQRKAIREEGVSLDRLSETMFDQGYITEPQPEALLDAIDRELSGDPVFSEQQAQQNLIGERQSLLEFQDYLERTGIDIQTMSNEEIKQLLEMGDVDVADETVLQQTEQTILEQLPRDGVDVYRAYAGMEGDIVEIISLTKQIIDQHKSLHSIENKPEYISDEQINQIPEPAFIQGNTKLLSFVYTDNGDVYHLINKTGEVKKLEDEQRKNIAARTLPKIYNDIRDSSPEAQAAKEKRRQEREIAKQRDERIKNAPKSTGDFDTDIQSLAEYAENFEEFKQLLSADMLDVSDRNRTRLARAAIALDPEVETAANVVEMQPDMIEDALRYGTPEEKSAASAINSKAKKLTIYRAMPASAKIEAGDWVGLVEGYAKGHESNVIGEKAVTRQKTVNKEDLYWYGADFNEWVYIPKGTWGDYQSLQDVWEKLSPNKPLTYEQKERGQIKFGKDLAGEPIQITFFDSANLSTMLHESGHLYLEILKDLSRRGEASASIESDLQTVADWLGVEQGEDITVEQHEQFARSFEAYLREGKAPSKELQTAFAKFRAWLVAIYRNIKNLNTTINDDIREVFDRLLATDEQIQETSDQMYYDRLFESAEQAGWTEEEFIQYRKDAILAREEANAQVLNDQYKEMKREETKWWADALEETEAEVTEEYSKNPTYQALSYLQFGKFVEGPLPEGMEWKKINKQALVDRYGASFLKQLPRPYIYTVEGGVHQDEIGLLFGYSSGDQMLQDIVNAPKYKDAFDATVQERMREKYGDMNTDGTLPLKAMDAVHNTKQIEVLNKEFEALSKRSRSAQKATPADQMQLAAKNAINRKLVRDVNPNVFVQAERKAAKQSIDAVIAGDFDLAAEAKQRQILNFYMGNAAREAAQETDVAVRYLNKFNKRSTREKIGKAGGDYLEQIDTLLEKTEFRQVSLKTLNKRQSLERFIIEQEENGWTVDVPESLIQQTLVTNWKDLRVEELVGLKEAVQNIDHIATFKNKLLDEKAQRDFEGSVNTIVASVEANHKVKPEEPNFAKTFKDTLKEKASGFVAYHTKMEFLFEYLDGYKAGGDVWKTLFRPLADAENAEQKLQGQYVEKTAAIFDRYTAKERSKWYTDKYNIINVGSMNKATIFAAALNVGNAGNKKALMEGYGWNEVQLQRILAKLDKKDWETVQSIWDMIDELWPDISKLQKDLTGLAPEKVDALKVKTDFGTFNGGYYPLVGDSSLSWDVFKRDEKNLNKTLFENNYLKPATQKGHTIERTDFAGRPVKLSLDVIGRHLNNVIHDLTHRRAIMDVDRMVNDPKVRTAIEGTAGKEMYRQIRPWLQGIAQDNQQIFSAWEEIFAKARTGATIVNMGWKFTTAFAQPLGYLQSVDEIGVKAAWQGLTDFYGSQHKMKARYNFVMDRSEMMRNRQKTFDRDIKDTIRRIEKEGKLDGVRQSFFYMTGLFDMGVAMPTWLGAYRQAMDGLVENIAKGDENSAIEYADRTVRVTQSAGSIKDLAQIQRGSNTFRLFTMFYSYFNVLFNLLKKRGQQYVKGDINTPQLAASAIFLWIAPAILGEMAASRLPGEDEEWIPWAAKHVGMYPFMSVVGVRDVVNGLGPYGYTASPAFDAFEQTVKAVKIPFKAAAGEEITRSDVKSAVLATSYWGQLPGRQGWITGEYIYDVMTGQDEPEDIWEFTHDLMFARPASERN